MRFTFRQILLIILLLIIGLVFVRIFTGDENIDVNDIELSDKESTLSIKLISYELNLSLIPFVTTTTTTTTTMLAITTTTENLTPTTIYRETTTTVYYEEPEIVYETPSYGVNWDAIAECESGGNWSINTGNGYYGGLQFSHSTWIAYGGSQYSDNAHLTSRENQISIASGMSLSHWPSCGRYG